VAPPDDREGRGDDDGGGWLTLHREPTGFDLLALQNGAVAALGALELPPGKVTQIRLHLVPGAVNQVHMKGGAVCPLSLGNVEQAGVKITHPFKVLVVEDETTHVVVDLDVRESVSKEGDCLYRLNPVVKIKSVEGPR
jgi:hypothetical protein